MAEGEAQTLIIEIAQRAGTRVYHDGVVVCPCIEEVSHDGVGLLYHDRERVWAAEAP